MTTCPSRLDREELNWDAFSDDVSMSTGRQVKALPDDGIAAGPFYSHGYSLRVVVLQTDREAALTALGRIDWASDSPEWRRTELNHCQRWIVKGSTFITHSKPRNKSLPMARFNASWKTHLYSLVVEDDGRKIALTFHGVRRHDVETVLQGKMGLGSGDYHIEHYTALERYFVLLYSRRTTRFAWVLPSEESLRTAAVERLGSDTSFGTCRSPS